MLTRVVLVISFALLNRGRGSHFWNHFDSTLASRIVCVLSMSILTMIAAALDELRGNLLLIWTFVGLSLWAFPGWDNYWGAAIGNTFNPNANTCKPVDWLMKRMPWFPTVYTATASDLQRRIWGATAMGLRQSLALPCIIGIAFFTGHSDRSWYAAGTLLFGITYLIAGYASTKSPVACAEYAVGGGLGFIIFQTII